MNTWREAYDAKNYEEAKQMLLEGVEKQETDEMFSCAQFLINGDCGFEKNVKKAESILLQLSKIDGNDYSDMIGKAYFGENQYMLATRYLEQAFRKGKRDVLEHLIISCYESGDYTATYQYAMMDNITYVGPVYLAFLYERGEYVQKDRGKAHEYYKIAGQRPGIPQSVRSVINDGQVRTYYGTAAQGRYIVKRLTIAIVASLFFLIFAAICASL